jgi:hypothetical protein
MAQYVVKLTVPKNTPERSPANAELTPAVGSIERGRIMFPLNAAGLVGVRLLDRSSVFMPAPGSVTPWVTGDGVTIEWEEDYRLSGAPFRLVVEAYNIDDTYDRTIEVRLEIVRTTMRELMGGLIAELGRLAATLATSRR